jgi:hypothetical protein
MTVTVDTLLYTADSTYPTADGFVPAGAIVLAEVVEGPAAHVTVDSTAYTADATHPTADGFIPVIGAADVLDATVEAAVVPIYGGAGRPLPLPEPVFGVGFGILPQLEGEAFGAIIVAGAGVSALAELEGEATGTIGVAGRSAAQLVIRAAAIGDRGTTGTAVAILEGLSVVSDGAIGVCGSGSGPIVKFEATATGRHDDDEAAIMTFLLAA